MDIPNKIDLDITEEDIKQGKRCSSDECVIAQHLKRMGHKEVEVMATRFYIGNVAYWLDYDGRELVIGFDYGKTILPCKITAYHYDDRNISPKLGRPKKEKV